MPAAPAVDRSTLRLSEVARHVVIPEGIVDSLWFEVEPRVAEFGIEFDVWQDGVAQVILGLREDGMFAATVGGITLSIPRQVAKTFIVMVLVLALCTLYPNLTVLWTAHRTRTATNTFQKMKAMALRPAVRGYLKPGSNQGTAIRDANGEQEIPFKNGSRVLFGAREAGFGRGFDEVDIEVFDEAQILTIRALEDMVAATNQSRFPFGALLFYMNTPPRPTDPGEMILARRAEALEHKKGLPDFGEPVAAGDAVYIECSADPDVGKPGGPSLDDPKQVETANPSYPHRTPPVAVARLRKNMPDDASWRREGLGVYDDVVLDPAVIPRAAWEALGVPEAPAEGIDSYGVKFSPDGATVALCAARKTEDGVIHLELIERRSMGGGTGWLVEWLAGGEAPRWRKAAQIVVDGKAHAGNLVNALRSAGVPARVVVTPTTDQVTAAHSMLEDAVKAKTITVLAHPGQATLVDSVAASARREIGKTGGWGFRPIGDGECTSAESAVMAHWGAKTSKRRPGRKQRVVVG